MDGLREEVDTFMFEVGIFPMISNLVYWVCDEFGRINAFNVQEYCFFLPHNAAILQEKYLYKGENF